MTKEERYPLIASPQTLTLHFYQDSRQFYWQDIIAIFIPKNSPKYLIIMSKNDEGFDIFIEDIKDGENIMTILQSYWQKYAPENAHQTFPEVEEYKAMIDDHLDEFISEKPKISWQRKTIDFLFLIISAVAIFIFSIILLETIFS